MGVASAGRGKVEGRGWGTAILEARSRVSVCFLCERQRSAILITGFKCKETHNPVWLEIFEGEKMCGFLANYENFVSTPSANFFNPQKFSTIIIMV